MFYFQPLAIHFLMEFYDIILYNYFFYRLHFYFYDKIETHIGSTCHNYPLSLDQAEPASSQILSSFHTVTAQPKIATSIRQRSDEAYLKMLRTVYTLSLEPKLPSQEFKTLVKVHPKNGVRFIKGERYYFKTKSVQYKRFC